LAPDFSRDVHCILGLPFDAIDMDGAVAKVRSAAASGNRCFLSTPNLNFAIAAQSNSQFRDSVLHSDLNIADGMPLIWVAKLLGIPMPERVAGSTLFERLRERAATPIKVFFFGGPDGVAARACEQLNARSQGLRCVGFDAPGFGSIEDMSGADRIARINASAADFLVVSLGAQKGQAWIERNLDRLHTPVVSHLGAVVNFVAGTVRRSPSWMGRIGFEWLWRIKEEPALWRRYANDAMVFGRLLLTRVVPQVFARCFARSTRREQATYNFTKGVDSMKLTLSGAWTANDIAPLRSVLAEAAVDRRRLTLDLRNLSHADPALIGLLSLLWLHLVREGRPWSCLSIHPAGRRCLRNACAEYMLDPGIAPGALAKGSVPC
jgi:N-acetylglucosaminyldiphosphoundecaprenol N-acetyl-beta-D-mannosaminyltransferase